VKEILLVVDGHNIASRAWFTNNHFGFYNMTLDAVRDVDLDYVAIVFDSPGSTWRHELYPDYKANRKPDPDRQAYIADIKASLDGLVPMYCIPGEEADDVIASLSKWPLLDTTGPYRHCYILSNDGDLLALVNSWVSVIAPATSFKNRVTHTPESVHKKMDVWPYQICDYKAMVGDRSDGIPGTKLIGPVTARKLLAEHKDKTGILNAIADANWDEKPRWARLIEDDEANFELSYKLAELRHPDVSAVPLTPFAGEEAFHKALRKYRAGLP
jgi:DNA polymerase-1